MIQTGFYFNYVRLCLCVCNSAYMRAVCVKFGVHVGLSYTHTHTNFHSLTLSLTLKISLKMIKLSLKNKTNSIYTNLYNTLGREK